MKFQRAGGVLLHPTSLPNEFGIGDLGNSAYRFADLLHKAKQTYWQILPLGPTGFGDSPYQCFSAFAGNTNLISPELLIADRLLSKNDFKGQPVFPEGEVDYGLVIEWKNRLLSKAFKSFRKSENVDLKRSFESFTEQVAGWLNEYALFRAIKASQGEKLWLEWDEPLRLRHSEALRTAREDFADEIIAQKFYQFLFFKQWVRLKNYVNGKGIKIIGDIPIFVSLDSADVWAHPDQFKLNPDGSPRVVAGVPPDYYSETGQRWGNPIYDWDRMRTDGFGWWKFRFGFTQKTVDIVRIDHFRGFAAAWEIPGEDETAENGEWVDVPGHELFEALCGEFGDLPVMAEDLGVMTDDVVGLRQRFGFPGMKILQFGFGGDSKSVDLPHNFERNCVAYTGCHDNDTVVGWFESKAEKGSTRLQKDIDKERKFCLRYLNSDGDQISWDFIRAIWSSVADTAIVPMQDILGLDGGARMNLPATVSGNWKWRATKRQLTSKTLRPLRKLTELYGRIDAN